MPNIYQTVLVNFGRDVYIGFSLVEAIAAAKVSGFEASILLDGSLVASYSPIGGQRFFN